MDIKKKKKLPVLFLLGITLFLGGCRTRVQEYGQELAHASADRTGTMAGTQLTERAEAGETAESGEDGVSGEHTRENPEAARREYDEDAPVEIADGTDRLLHMEGEGRGQAAEGPDAMNAVSMVREDTQETAVMTVAAEEAEQTGVDEEGEEADSALTYFKVLIQDRMRSVFECQRANVYLETEETFRTVHRTSAEHALILASGCYDVSSRLLEENLTVDAGWVMRKHPDMIVKIVDSSILGGSVSSAGRAGKVCEEVSMREGWEAMEAVRQGRIVLLSREMLEAPYLQVAAMLVMDKTFLPELFEDVDLEKAVSMLAEEATGQIPGGIYYYVGTR